MRVSVFLEFTIHGVPCLVLLRVPAWAHVPSAQKSGNGQRGHSGISNHGNDRELKRPFRPSGHLSKAESEKVPSQAFWGRWRVIQKRVLYPEMETQALMPQSRMLSRLQCCSLDNKASNLFQTRIGWYSCLTLEMLSFSDFLETLPNQCGVGEEKREDWVLPAVSKSGEPWKVGGRLYAPVQEGRATEAVTLRERLSPREPQVPFCEISKMVPRKLSQTNEPTGF